MEPSMSNKPTALLVVEGGKDEKTFFEHYQKAYGLDFEICCFRTNIYSLYADLKKYGFNADIKAVLGARCPEYKSALQRKFAYTYLVFDLDAHHTKKDETRTLEDIFRANIIKAHKMTQFFVDETDPTVGRLYINYPMHESFRACDGFNDNSYQNEIVSLYDAAHFKQYANSKKLSSIHVNSYTTENFLSLSRLNVLKLNLLVTGQWAPLSYSEYLNQSGADNILSYEERYITAKKAMQVLNTSLFIAVDYFGNKNQWYDSHINTPLHAQ